MILRPGDYLQNRYEILELIGSGGMSEVYRAHCHKLNRDVAVKVLKREFCSDEEFVRKFKMEAQAAGALNHPNIVNVYDVVDEEELHYIVMEMVDGITIKAYIKEKGRLELRETLEIARQVARGIGAAHQRGIVHRDVKSQNMILSRDGKVKVADFGIARAVSAQTMSSQAMGSVHYISPEQAKGDYTDARSDIYSLGITIYEMATGRLPFDGDTAVSVALSHIEEEITPPSAYNPEIPEGLERIILKCTKKDPAERYQNVDDLIADMQEVYENTGAIPAGVGGPPSGEDAGDTKTIDRKELYRKRRESGKAKKSGQEPPEAENEDAGLDRMLKTVGIILAIAVALGALFLFSQLIRIFPPSGGQTANESASSPAGEEKVYTPYLIGSSEPEARKELAKYGLELSVVSEEHSRQFEEGLIMRQSPEAGEMAKRRSSVRVVLSLGSGETELSEFGLEGMDAGEARALLAGKGFQIETREEYSAEVEAGKVISCAPEKVAAGATVTLAVSRGPEQKTVAAPNITGAGEEEAKAQILAAGLKEGKREEAASDTVPVGKVISQAPAAGSAVVIGSALDYVVSLGPAVADPAYTVEPIGGDSNSRYVASINNTYELKNLIGPGSSMTSVTVMIRLRQEVGGQTIYQTLMEPRTVTADTIMPVRFRAIEGVYGVDTGHVEIVRTDNDTVLQSYEVQFFKVQ